MAETRRVSRLDQPREPGRLTLPRLDTDAFGRFAETFARFMGTARFLVYMTIFVIVWITVNLIGLFGFRWDPYPFILLNLFFSTQASYAAPLILLAQNRQTDRDRLSIDEDRRRAMMQKADTEYLSREIASLRVAVGEVATRDFVRSELTRLIEELDDAAYRRHKADRKETRKEIQKATRRAVEATTDTTDLEGAGLQGAGLGATGLDSAGLGPDDDGGGPAPQPEMRAPRASRG